jgi:hypothetical protein
LDITKAKILNISIIKSMKYGGLIGVVNRYKNSVTAIIPKHKETPLSILLAPSNSRKLA